MRASCSGRRLRLLAAALAATAGFGCETVDLMEPPSDINACRPSQSYFVGDTNADGGMRGGLWQNLFDKPYSDGRRCHDAGCHGDGATNSLKLMPPSCLPPCVPPIPLTLEWADDYRAAAEEMNCANVASSRLIEFPTGIRNHGGGTLFTTADPEYDLIIGWVGAAP